MPIDRNADSQDRCRTNWQQLGELVWNEVPTGTIDGVNGSFTLLRVPRPSGSIMVFSDGLKLPAASYSLSGKALTITSGMPASSLEVTYSW